MLSTAFALTYGMNFASIAALVSHTYLFHGPEIWRRLRSSKGELDDVHMKIMRKYKLVPTWWYLVLLAVMTAFAFISALAYPTGMAWYSVILSLIIATVFTIPIGIIQAFTNIQLGLNVFTEFIIGYLQPGHPIAMMMFKTFGYIVMTQALYFCQDLKLGHYMHVPQRSMFTAQLVATVWSCLCQLATVEWAMGAIKNVCTSAASGSFTCASIKTFYNASVIWGAIGPKHLFSDGATYQGLQYFWLAGFISPFIVYALARVFPKMSLIRKISMPLIFACFSYVPPYTAMNIVSPLSSALNIMTLVLTDDIAFLVRCWLGLQQVPSPKASRMVDGIQLHHLCRLRCWSCSERHHYFLLRGAAWRRHARLLGIDYSFHYSGRRWWQRSEDRFWRRDFWSQDLEMVINKVINLQAKVGMERPATSWFHMLAVSSL